MRSAQIVFDFPDGSQWTSLRTISDGIAKLEQVLGAPPPLTSIYLTAPDWSGEPASFLAIRFEPSQGRALVIPFPYAKRCRVRGALGATFFLGLRELDGARVNQKGGLELRDGRSFEAATLDILPQLPAFSDLQHAIILLTIRFLGEEQLCIRHCLETGTSGIDYSMVTRLSVQNVKELAKYVNQEIGKLNIGAPEETHTSVSLRQIHRALDVAGIQKQRGRPQAATRNASTI